jgi:ceramide glucosyltransferase
VHTVLTLLLAALVAGSLVYCVMVAVAVRSYRKVRQPSVGSAEPVSILKPLHGVDEGLEENLRSFFTQDYPIFEILFAVRDAADPAVAVVERLRREYPQVPAGLVVTGEPPYPNAKVFSLDHMLRAASFDLLVMSDSDIRVDPRMLMVVAGEFRTSAVGVATCPYRAVAGRSLWSKLEAVGMNTEFWGGVLVARMLEGMRFAVGPTIVARREVLAKIGGFDVLKDYLAEDFVLGERAADAGCGVILSSYVIEHCIGSEGIGKNFGHRIRWARSTRRSRPAGYIGQAFTNPLPLALGLLAVAPAWWPMVLVTLVLRAIAAETVARGALRLSVNWWLLPVQDMLSFIFWVAGFFGNHIAWRGRRYRLLPDGRFELER